MQLRKIIQSILAPCKSAFKFHLRERVWDSVQHTPLLLQEHETVIYRNAAALFNVGNPA